MGKGRPWDKEQSNIFVGDLHFDLDSGILLLLHLFAIRKKHYFTTVCWASTQHYNADDFSDEPYFNILHQFHSVKLNIFLGRGLNLWALSSLAMSSQMFVAVESSNIMHSTFKGFDMISLHYITLPYHQGVSS